MIKQPWYTIQARASAGSTTVEIRIHDEIGGGGTTSKSFIEDLDRTAPTAADILLSINSPGGDVFAAIGIFNALRRYRGKITGRVDGVAASAASFILMAAQRIVMPENAMLMIHNPWTITGGEAGDLRKLADMMDQVRASFVTAYVERSGQPAAEVERMMDDTTWMDAFEAQRLGFCDEVEDPVRLAASASAVSVLGKYKGAPTALMAGMRRAATRPDKGADQDTPQAIIEYVYAQCRARGFPSLANLLAEEAAGGTRAMATQRLEFAEQVAGLCRTAKVLDKASDFIRTGLSIEQIRTRLWDHLVAESEGAVISNVQRPAGNDSTGAGQMDQVKAKVYEGRAR